MESYNIIDEPKPSWGSTFVLDPIAILFLCIFIPVLWSPPLAATYWFPLVWMVANGIFMGSPTIKKELLIAVLGGLTLLGLLIGFGAIAKQDGMGVMVFPYFRILLKAALFLCLYYIAFIQSGPYALHQYIYTQGQSNE
ncbi:hypothetical protein Q4519_01665 [Motilimonas sp. 1_MG-2023]|uniref:Uncharacterized protein n=1 Tax=Motilimonas cestriensis TaxID=2742685 RepID=A0ABS8W7S0_9GAMM|nr:MULTISPECIES: hypothetical protein [Motilimonas]MCE2595044.1 hypothetical protein [Motilimonas cestriensis]MDO6524379.1 hypothetical protein [Motilimonas sp. 1_MG-2023]